MVFRTDVCDLSDFEIFPVIYTLFFALRTELGAQHDYKGTFILPDHLPKLRDRGMGWSLASDHGLFGETSDQSVDVVCIHIGLDEHFITVFLLLCQGRIYFVTALLARPRYHE